MSELTYVTRDLNRMQVFARITAIDIHDAAQLPVSPAAGAQPVGIQLVAAQSIAQVHVAVPTLVPRVSAGERRVRSRYYH